ncbi:hypothetical protein pb186bvf_019101 [Paramecium bursaria]
MVDRALAIWQSLGFYHMKHQCYLKYKLQGDTLLSKQKHYQSILIYDEAVFLDPKDASAYNSIGNTFQSLQKYEQIYYDQALQPNPIYKKAIILIFSIRYQFFFLGNAFCLLEKYEEAIAIYDQAIELNPKDEESFNCKGMALGYIQKCEESKALQLIEIQQEIKAIKVQIKLINIKLAENQENEGYQLDIYNYDMLFIQQKNIMRNEMKNSYNSTLQILKDSRLYSITVIVLMKVKLLVSSNMDIRMLKQLLIKLHMLELNKLDLFQDEMRYPDQMVNLHKLHLPQKMNSLKMQQKTAPAIGIKTPYNFILVSNTFSRNPEDDPKFDTIGQGKKRFPIEYVISGLFRWRQVAHQAWHNLFRVPIKILHWLGLSEGKSYTCQLTIIGIWLVVVTLIQSKIFNTKINIGNYLL